MHNKKLRKELLKQMVTLATAGFGLVAALAWNEAVQAFVNEYINKYLSVGSGIISKFVYAALITAIAVFVTYQLAKFDKDD
ncbi:hypothetical protein A2870_03745 [Candidatus Curtissbacteria bacterium RIFCSPHIGHO2_01_FULL_41_11]|uniref:Uncharacterized protein n=1 Tax=Candidatus Curtissbacteria bacterium RIFCSPHIGHO2_01_FULL_41_11 TaxID=1797711 RepID=A0A1F5G425_9BACT|nr:MAG: hypothetical protein A2870_03745 [Candidatus Curtissbacteria bacterium RIFCSPHIGHO2_01_FULL_41_11]